MKKTNINADSFFHHSTQWREEFMELRQICRASGLDETLKWGQPCYTLDNKNIVLIHGFKEYCALLFFKGSLLQDPHHLLIQQTENVQSARQIRFTDLQKVKKLKLQLKNYIQKAIAVEQAGLRVEFKKTADYKIAEEFQYKLDHHPLLQKAFRQLTPGRQRAYLFYFSQAKQSKTRIARIEKSIPKILDGKGMDD